MADSEESSDTMALNLGHEGVGDNCFEKVLNQTGKFLVAGGAIGAAEGCFLTPAVGSTNPLIFRALGLMAQRSLLFGTVGGVYAGGVCMAAALRDKDDYVNASVGGALAGSIFGIKTRSIPLGLGMAALLAFTLGVIKFRNNTYYPNPFPIPRGLPGPAPITGDKRTAGGNS